MFALEPRALTKRSVKRMRGQSPAASGPARSPRQEHAAAEPVGTSRARAGAPLLARDRAGREMPRPRWVRRVLGPDEYWLQSTDSERSFDSRYHGPVRRGQIRDRRVPVLTMCGAPRADAQGGRRFQFKPRSATPPALEVSPAAW
jgi:hypothetical protein